MMKPKNYLQVTIPVALLVSGTAGAATVAYWNFDEGVDGEFFSNNPSEDQVSGIEMQGFDETFGPVYSSDSPTGSGLVLDTLDGGRDGYTTDAGFNAFGPEQWTIEATVRLDEAGGFQTVIGRDGSSFGNAESDFYLQKFDDTGSWRTNFRTASNEQIVIDGLTVDAGVWYQLAVVSDGSEVRFYNHDLSGPDGWELQGTAALTGATAADNALAATGANWTFGRGWFDGNFGDSVTGVMDEVRFSDSALDTSELITVPEPSVALIAGMGLFGLARRRRR